jgi:hypothetical protein
MATPATTKPKAAAAKPAAHPPLELSPELETFAVVKLGKPDSFWRLLNRVYAWATGQISRDEWDAAFMEALKLVDGKALHPDDAARRVERLLAAMLDLGDKGRAVAAVAKCEASEHAVLVAFIGHPSQGFYHARHLRLLDEGKRRG